MVQPPQPSVNLPLNISHYRLERLLGAGGMGEVYLAVDRRDGQQVVVKLLHPHLEDQPGFRERFEREAHVAALLRSPYTVHLHDYGIAFGRYFLVMDYVEGHSLRDELDRGPIAPERALRIGVQVARALEEAQARGVVHRDIKPENIMLMAGDSVKVLDFGIARLEGASNITLPGVFVGTAAYSAPETVHGQADTRSDIYSTGATLFHAVVGRPPYSGNLIQVLEAHSSQPIPVHQLEHLPPAVAGVIERCLAKNPENRYQSASQLAAALERAAASPSAVERIAAIPPDAATILEPRGPVAAAMPSTGAYSSVQIELRQSAQHGRRATYELLLRNPGPSPTSVSISAADAAKSAMISMPGLVNVPPGGAVAVPIEVKPRHTRLWGPEKSVPFTVTGRAGDGPPIDASSTFKDLPFGRWPLFAAAGLAALAGAAGIAVALGGGGGGGGASPLDNDSPTPVHSATARPSATRSATKAPATTTATQAPTDAPTATPVPPTATPVPPTATPVPPTATPVPPTATPVPPTPTSPPVVVAPRMDSVILCSESNVCIGDGGTLYSSQSGCYPNVIKSWVKYYDVTLPAQIAVRWTQNGSLARNDGYTETQFATGQSWATLEPNSNTGFSLVEGSYYVEWGLVGGQPLAAATFYLSCA